MNHASFKGLLNHPFESSIGNDFDTDIDHVNEKLYEDIVNSYFHNVLTLFE